MSMADIRKSRKVPAKRGMRVEMDGKPGVITGSHGGYVKVLFDGFSYWEPCHPTWRMVYILDDGTRREFGMG